MTSCTSCYLFCAHCSVLYLLIFGTIGFRLKSAFGAIRFYNFSPKYLCVSNFVSSYMTHNGFHNICNVDPLAIRLNGNPSIEGSLRPRRSMPCSREGIEAAAENGAAAKRSKCGGACIFPGTDCSVAQTADARFNCNRCTTVKMDTVSKLKHDML